MIAVSSKCERKHSDIEFIVREQLSEVIFLNASAKRVRQITVDGCVFTEQDTKRCDYLVNVDETNLSILVELKGSDIEAAFEQLKAAQELMIDHLNRRIQWIISYSGSPRFETTIQNLILRAALLTPKARLRVEASPYHHSL